MTKLDDAISQLQTVTERLETLSVEKAEHDQEVAHRLAKLDGAEEKLAELVLKTGQMRAENAELRAEAAQIAIEMQDAIMMVETLLSTDQPDEDHATRLNIIPLDQNEEGIEGEQA